MKKSNLFLIPTILFVCSIIISSCGGKSSAEATAGSNAKAKEFANSMCKIADEIGLDENFKLTEDYLNKKEEGKKATMLAIENGIKNNLNIEVDINNLKLFESQL